MAPKFIGGCEGDPDDVNAAMSAYRRAFNTAAKVSGTQEDLKALASGNPRLAFWTSDEEAASSAAALIK